MISVTGAEAKFAKEERETLFLILIRDTRKKLEKKKDLEIKRKSI